MSHKDDAQNTNLDINQDSSQNLDSEEESRHHKGCCMNFCPFIMYGSPPFYGYPSMYGAQMMPTTMCQRDKEDIDENVDDDINIDDENFRHKHHHNKCCYPYYPCYSYYPYYSCSPCSPYYSYYPCYPYYCR